MDLPLSIPTKLVLVRLAIRALVVTTTNCVLSVIYLRLWFDGAMPTLEFVCHFRWLHTYKC